MKIENTKHYHGVQNEKCILVIARREKKEEGHLLDIWKCLLHSVETCRCGWEWGHHGDN